MDMLRITVTFKPIKCISAAWLASILLVASTASVSAADVSRHADKAIFHGAPPPGERTHIATLPTPPRPTLKALPSLEDTRLKIRERAVKDRNGTTSTRLAPESIIQPISYAGAPGAASNRKTLVVYDDSGEWGWLGEAYAVMAAQLASHGSAYAMKAAENYQGGELDNYTGLIYIGSTYDEPLPIAFLDDVAATSKPVLWMNYNIWQMTAHHPDFSGKYGWLPKYYDYGETTAVTYRGVALDRNPQAAQAGLLQVQIDNPMKVEIVATASGNSTASLPWAVRSGNFTYIGEIPFSYIGPDDRYLAAADLIGTISNPAMPDRKRALVRIEDVGPDADPGELRAIADYLHQRKVPFSVAVYPYYRDPNGVYSGGVPVEATLKLTPDVVSALKYMQKRGGTLLMHGYTHQYSNVPNPYGGTSADDFEFYLAHVDADDYVRYDGPVPEDSATWVNGRIDASANAFKAAGLPIPTIFEAPHYAMSALDYQVVHARFGRRYDRGLYAADWCPDGACGNGVPDYSHIYGQYFPYLIRDIFGSIVVPESLGNIEVDWFNNHPPRLPADILHTAHLNTVVRDRVLSFFFHPYNDIAHLKAVVEGIQGMGYQFVTVETVMNP